MLGGVLCVVRHCVSHYYRAVYTIRKRLSEYLAAFFYWGWFGNLFVDAHDFLGVVDVFFKRGLETYNELGAIG